MKYWQPKILKIENDEHRERNRVDKTDRQAQRIAHLDKETLTETETEKDKSNN